MQFTKTSLDGVQIIDLERHADERGFFARTWCVDEFAEAGLTSDFVQASISHNTDVSTLRGMHFQVEPYGETKLITCVAGAIHDVLIDLRPDSPTLGQWEGFDLSADNGRLLYVPQGFAHGFQTLAPNTTVSYQIDRRYQPGSASGVRWDDPAFAIIWPEPERERIMSDKDRTWPDYGAVSGTDSGTQS